jgi:hypothetical protein
MDQNPETDNNNQTDSQNGTLTNKQIVQSEAPQDHNVVDNSPITPSTYFPNSSDISSNNTITRGLLLFVFALALIAFGAFKIGIIPTSIIAVATVSIVYIVLIGSRRRRDKYFQDTGVKSYIASVHASQLQIQANSITPNKWISGSLLVSNKFQWQPSNRSVSKGVSSIEFSQNDVQNCKVTRQPSLFPAVFLFFTLNNGKKINFSVRDSRDLINVLQQKGLNTS